MLNVSEETVRRWIRTQELKAHQEGKSYIVKKDDLIEFVKEKAKEGTTSIGKMASLLPIAGVIAGGATASITKMIKMINSKTDVAKSEKAVQNEVVDTLSIAEIEESIVALERKKKKLDLEYQMNVLQIEEQIAEYQKLKQMLEKE
ncbi:helix-turn-helix domain-containing protein [Bacillus sp. HNG]|nr:helix-turn-helix domain-containing protein [Bacillus sp. HNG]